MARDIHSEFSNKPGYYNGGLIEQEDHTHGLSVDAIQNAYGRVAGLVAGREYIPALAPPDGFVEADLTYTPVGSSQLRKLTTIGPYDMTTRREKMRRALEEDMKENPSDYEEGQEADEESEDGDE
ncbi:hypothetical protein OPQ81_009399 [Rhizoctonia solani]|nr:hypothetical protein OPQ81_009399 [Rhizoctonia solani]